MNGIISYDDPDEYCQYFHNCVEIQGTVHPSGAAATQPSLGLDFYRWKWRRIWTSQDGQEWSLMIASTAWESDENNDTEDVTVSDADHIYVIDGPGSRRIIISSFGWVADKTNFLQEVLIRLSGAWRQCSDFLKWHTQWSLKRNGPIFTRDWGRPQEHGTGWIAYPSTP